MPTASKRKYCRGLLIRRVRRALADSTEFVAWFGSLISPASRFRSRLSRFVLHIPLLSGERLNRPDVAANAVGGFTLPAPSGKAAATDPVAAPSTLTMTRSALPAVSWEEMSITSSCCRLLKCVTGFRESAPPGTRLKGEEFVGALGKIIGALTSAGPLMPLLQDLYGRLGGHTGKACRQTFGTPTGV